MAKKAKKQNGARVNTGSGAICTVSYEEAVEASKEYTAIGEMIADLEKRRGEYKNIFGTFATAYGKDNGKGSLYFQDTDGNFIGLQKRSGRKVIDPEKAQAYFKSLGLLKEVTRTIIDESKITALVARGDIEEDDISHLYTEGAPSFAASIISREKMEKYGNNNQIEETDFSLR